MNSLHIYNSKSATKELFKPIVDNHIGMYVCGPTVYSNVHLGNCRTFISFDMIYRYLNHLGYKVRYVRNITDVGHLENDADQGEDKISKKARLEALEPMEIVQKYTIDFHNVLSKFNTLPPSIEPTATAHIIEQIEMIKTIINKGYAYEVNGSVYFDIEAFNKEENYGELSNRNLEEMQNNSRELTAQSDKRNAQDFALWKKAEPKHIMRWSSPWGDGFPGWHLECTAMSTKYLGEKFDIHGGGMDLKFPHHECEIAQSKAHCGKDPVNYWMHTNMLTLNGKKMSKSTDNNIMPKELFSGESPLLTRGYDPMVVRFFMMQAHYRSVLDFSDQALKAAQKGYTRLTEALTFLESLDDSKDILSTKNNEDDFNVENWIEDCYKAMNDDFNTPILISKLFDAVKHINLIKEGKQKISKKALTLWQDKFSAFVYDILGLKNTQTNISSNDTESRSKLEKTLEILCEVRQQAKLNKDFATSDHIRNKLTELGIELKDTAKGTEVTIN